MRIYVADGQRCWAEGYGSFLDPLRKVWFVPRFAGRLNLFSDIVVMGDGYNCERIDRSLHYFLGEDHVLTRVFRRNRWILPFKLSRIDGSVCSRPQPPADEDLPPSLPALSTALAHGTGMGLLPVPVQTRFTFFGLSELISSRLIFCHK